MAETADVCLALATIIENTVFPNGTAQPSILAAALAAEATLLGLGQPGTVGIYQNWPVPSDIDNRCAAGDVLIATIDTGLSKDTKRFPVKTQRVSTSPITLTWTINGTVATIGGTVAVPQNLCLEVNGQPYLYQVKAGDTLNSIAASFVVLIPGASAVGPAITVPSAKLLVARVGGVSSTVKEVGRQMSRFQVSVWAATDALRAATVKAIKPVLDDLRRFNLVDGTGAYISGSYAVRIYDPNKLAISQTNIYHQIEFASTVLGSAAQAIAWLLTVQGGSGDPSTWTSTEPPPFNVSI